MQLPSRHKPNSSFAGLQSNLDREAHSNSTRAGTSRISIFQACNSAETFIREIRASRSRSFGQSPVCHHGNGLHPFDASASGCDQDIDFRECCMPLVAAAFLLPRKCVGYPRRTVRDSPVASLPRNFLRSPSRGDGSCVAPTHVGSSCLYITLCFDFASRSPFLASADNFKSTRRIFTLVRRPNRHCLFMHLTSVTESAVRIGR